MELLPLEAVHSNIPIFWCRKSAALTPGSATFEAKTQAQSAVAQK